MIQRMGPPETEANRRTVRAPITDYAKWLYAEIARIKKRRRLYVESPLVILRRNGGSRVAHDKRVRAATSDGTRLCESHGIPLEVSWNYGMLKATCAECLAELCREQLRLSRKWDIMHPQQRRAMRREEEQIQELMRDSTPLEYHMSIHGRRRYVS